MNVSYKREMRHNYLILEAMEKEENFEIRMLTGNSIEGLLKFRIKQEEKAKYYYYEITSKQPLSRLLELKEIEKEELRTLIVEIGAILKRIEDYLLSESSLLLNPEYIYIEPESYQVWLCYIPGYEKSFPGAMEKLLQYLLKKTNHKDNDTVVLAYRLYQESQKDYYGIEDLLRVVRESQKGSSKEKVTNIQKAGVGESMNERLITEEVFDESFDQKMQKKRTDKWQSQRENQEGAKKRGKENSGKNSWITEIKSFTGLMGILFLGPLAVWLYAGTAGLRQYYAVLLVIDSIVVLSALAYLWRGMKKSSVKKKKNRAGKAEEWQMTFEEGSDVRETEREMETEKNDKNGAEIYENAWGNDGIVWENDESTRENYGNAEDNRLQNGKKLNIGREETEDTVLLAEASMEGEHVHLLKSINPSISDIPVPYFPFIIGKQEGIVDYVLKKDTISRIHLRLDEEDGRCKVTDLNSSNGTAVGDYRLEANETYTLGCGDQLIIADISFVFY